MLHRYQKELIKDGTVHNALLWYHLFILGGIIMKLSRGYFITLKEDAKDEDSISGNLLVRSGMIKKVGSGIYMFLPADEKLRHRNSSVTLTDDGFGCSYFFCTSTEGRN